MKRILGVILLSVGGAAIAIGGEPPLQPTRLRIEQRHDEPCFAEQQPRLSWWASGDGHCRAQSAYRIFAASNRDLLKKQQGDLWDSKLVRSGQSHLIEYGGTMPPALSEVWWTVQIWDEAGRASGFAEPRRWFVGPLHDKDWAGARWIAGDPAALHGFPLDGNPAEARPMAILRKGFRLDKPVRRAVAYVSGLGYYDLEINGQRAVKFGLGRHGPIIPGGSATKRTMSLRCCTRATTPSAPGWATASSTYPPGAIANSRAATAARSSSCSCTSSMPMGRSAILLATLRGNGPKAPSCSPASTAARTSMPGASRRVGAARASMIPSGRRPRSSTRQRARWFRRPCRRWW